ncbi:c-type cytochrome [Oceanospirillum sediminis]|uniref:Cytochrome c n=1 Tax=Oceanospirillum sediminis TaxID=2760088 RepID=A0A839IRI9_9GAMM|nr:cytochrome c [Oceanospirillum sediminis]MBB1486826.1 cytochrome c [Oceanospirillum sediminis]
MWRSILATLVFITSFGAYAGTQISDTDSAIKARQEQFKEIKTEFKQLRFEVVINEKFNAERALKHADKVADLTQSLIDMFRVRSDQGDTKALPVVWDKWNRFEQQMNDFRDITEQIAEALHYQNREDAADFVNQAAKSCKGCHRYFKKR